uniref:Ribosomal RNA small subunit methyltransferase G n=1 Tax=Candidatus Kentrum sp. LFY TaxID=2126342 RepID=A0A450ULH0_9GAMM|nr:MAG: 16S rRNA (guanine527-N7)-methyltransferase [Candidatus Kentron sp. LFY]
MDRIITTNEPLQSVRQCLGQTSFAPEEETCHALVRYVGLLARWNRAYNLTSVRDPVEMVQRHVLDCLVVAPYIRGTRLLDLGTGAGLPGVVLAIARPDVHCVLLDGNGKKTRFCTQVVTELRLPNVEVVHMRAEKYAPESPFTTVTARAFGPLSVLRGHAARLLAQGGRLLAMKGTMKEIMKEIDGIGGLGRSVPETTRRILARPRSVDSPRGYDRFSEAATFHGIRVVALEVPGLAAERHLVIIEQLSQSESLQ